MYVRVHAGLCGCTGVSVDLQVESLEAADVNTGLAKQVVGLVNSDKITVRHCDVTKAGETISLLREGFDVVTSALPRPFCDAATAAAIEAGVGYTDVAASFSTIFQQDEEARNAGVTVVPHIGLDRVLCGVGARIRR